MTEGQARYFTIEEANALLESLRPLVAQMMEAYERIAERLPDTEEILERRAANGGGRVAGDLQACNERLENTVRAIHSQGVLVRDLQRGLLDFPSRRGGREIFLCWLYDEPGVARWHEVDEGFPGRKPF
jgi:hypothetical protein